MKSNSKLLIILSFVLFDLTISFAQSFFNSFKSARAAGTAGITAGNSTLESCLGNPASLSVIENSTFLLTHENRFVNSGIKSSNFVFGLKLKSENAFAFSSEYYGLPEYNHLSIRTGYGMKLSKNFALGAGGGIIAFNNPGDDKPRIGILQFGIQYKFLDNLILGASINKLLIEKSLKENYMHSGFLVGFRYIVSSLVCLLGEFEKTNQIKGNLKFAFEYHLIKSFHLRCGVTTYPLSFSSGMSFLILHKINIDTTFSFYQQLGLTPSIGIRIPLKNINKTQE